MSKIFLSMPILNQPEFKSIYSTYQAILSCREHQVRLYVNENDSLISRVRNVHLSTFLNDYPDYEYFCSIDSDIEIVNCFSTNNIFSKLIAADKDFIGGLYALKQYENPPMCSSIPMDSSINRSTIPFNKGIIEMMWLSSGCWMIKRSAIEKMVQAYPELTYVGDDNVAGKKIHGLCIPAIFDVENNGQKFKKYLSEDWAFTERWRKIGGKIYADTSIVLRHLGKIPYQLWNVEVVSKKAEPKVEKPLPTLAELTEQINKNTEAINKNTEKVNLSLPPPGFDLIK